MDSCSEKIMFHIIMMDITGIVDMANSWVDCVVGQNELGSKLVILNGLKIGQANQVAGQLVFSHEKKN